MGRMNFTPYSSFNFQFNISLLEEVIAKKLRVYIMVTVMVQLYELLIVALLPARTNGSVGYWLLPHTSGIQWDLSYKGPGYYIRPFRKEQVL